MPAQGAEALGCLPGDAGVAVFEEDDEGGDGTGVAEGGEGIDGSSADSAVLIAQAVEDRLEAGFVADFGQYAQGGNAHFRFGIRQG